VRRGDRRYPMAFDWLLPAGAFSPVRCPSCGGDAPLVAGKQRLACERCLPRTPRPSVPAPAARAAPAAPAAKAHPPAPPPATAKAPPAAGSPRPASVPPAARRQPRPVPPHVRKERRAAPGKLAERLWNAVAAGPAGDAGAVLAPGSPAAALHGVLGAPGLTRVLGLPAGEAPARFSAQPAGAAGYGDLIAGLLLGDGGTQCHYCLCCQDALVVEVLPCPVTAGGEFLAGYWWERRLAGTGEPRLAGTGGRSPGRVPARSGLDPVGKALLSAGPGWNGLPVTARALAAWARIRAGQPPLLAAHEAPVLAAAVDRLVAYRAGGRAMFADAAAVYAVDEKAIRLADRAVRALLALGPGQPW